jgi:DNA-damage-inducible protein J
VFSLICSPDSAIFFLKKGKEVLSLISAIRKSGTNTDRKTTTMRVRVRPALKEETEEVFQNLGLTTSEAFNLFLEQVRLRGGLPFPIEIPNYRTAQVMKDIRAGRSLTAAENVDDLWDKLDKE